MKIYFPMYFEAGTYQELDLPDNIDPEDGDAVREYLNEVWEDIPLPDNGEWEYGGSCEFDWEAPYKTEGNDEWIY